MAKSHKEAAGDQVEYGEVNEQTQMTNNSDDKCQEAMSMDASPLTPRQSSMLPKGREGQATGMTGNAGVHVHQPLGAQTNSPQRHDGVMTSVHNSAQIAKCADSTSTDHQQQCEDVHGNDRGGSGLDDIEGHREVQGGGYDSGRGSGNSTANNASGES